VERKIVILVGYRGAVGSFLYSQLTQKYIVKCADRGFNYRSFVQSERPYAVVNAAGYYGNDRLRIKHSNIDLIRELLLALENSDTILIHLGSMGVISPKTKFWKNQEVFPSKEAYNPHNIYEKSKAVANVMIKSWNRNNDNRAYILNPSMILNTRSNNWVSLIPRMASFTGIAIVPNFKEEVDFCSLESVWQHTDRLLSNPSISEEELFIFETVNFLKFVKVLLPSDIKIIVVNNFIAKLLLLSVFPIINLAKGRHPLDQTIIRNVFNKTVLR